MDDPHTATAKVIDHQRMCLTTVLSTSLPIQKKCASMMVRHTLSQQYAACYGGEAGDAMRSISRRALLTSATAFCGLSAARSAPALILNDASHLNPVPVAGHAIV